ncbi:serine/threonine-protein kinase [Solwaraspora sp. WMMD1047]|uniref:serine/threonine-protein kinase n=1 Tax=Solwaraspora sp. WMMD1047 TaxID=3016102 RepID=UPI002415F69E|nr:serine/threonine-protein kinase [Solwaraspora sp. WMMD1047]MDG4832932.1 serine/threonine-protein kinase [Solwaraspora sp. WMMD1047]
MSVPERIGRYRVRRRLGSGAFATVWLADDEALQTSVAVKVLADNWTHQLDVRTRFTEEARILRRAESDRLVRVLDVGELADGRPYLVMTYATGGTLAERLGTGPLSVAHALRTAAELARGVAVLHDLGIIHRDLKPSNVLFAGTGGDERAVIGDLGLAKALAHASGFTIIAGSPGYMAPEQARLGAGLDARADVYALGALAYHMLTGRPPSLPASVQAVAAAAAQPVVRPTKLRPGIPPSVDAVLLRALHPNPERRWPSADAFAAALDAAALAAAARPVRRPVPGWRLAAVSVLTAAAVLAGTASDAGPPAGGRWARVVDASGGLSVAVPAAWAKQIRDAGWNPESIRLPAGRTPGLVVGTDLTAWSDPNTAVPGVFVGASRALTEVTPALPDHSGCAREPVRRYDLDSWTVVAQRWTGCGGTAISFTEALLTPVTGDYGLYVQIRQVDGTDHTEEILRGVRTTDTLAPAV